MKKYKKFIIFFTVVFLLLILSEMFKPRKINWAPSFSKYDKIPYGSFITYNILPKIFNNNIVTTRYPVYNEIDGNYYLGTNYIFINNDFKPDELDTKRLFEFVRKGNYVFAAAENINGKFADSLHLETGSKYLEFDSVEVNFSSMQLINEKPYIIKTFSFDNYFTKYDTVNTVVLGINKSKNPNFIKINIGDGAVYLNTTPAAFTNVNLLDSINTDYACKALSFLPQENRILWDEYYKINKSFIQTPLRYILSQESLKWAYYLLIGSIIFFIIFQGRRKQRIIPVLKPLANTTIEFINTIGMLYYQQKDHKNIAVKKNTYFLDIIRNKYFIKSEKVNNEMLERISIKSGVDLGDVKSIFNFIEYVNSAAQIKEQELIQINNLIESFYKKAGIHGGAI